MLLSKEQSWTKSNGESTDISLPWKMKHSDIGVAQLCQTSETTKECRLCLLDDKTNMRYEKT